MPTQIPKNGFFFEINYWYRFHKDSLIFVSGTPSKKNTSDDVIKLITNSIYPLETARNVLTKNINIVFQDSHAKQSLNDIKEPFYDHKKILTKAKLRLNKSLTKRNFLTIVKFINI